MPDVVGVFCSDDTICFLKVEVGCGEGLFCRFLGRFELEHPSDGRSAEMQTGPGKHLGYLLPAHDGAERFETFYNVCDEGGELVDGFENLDQSIVSLFINTFGPRRDGFGLNKECARGLGGRPALSGSEFEDGHALCGTVARTVERWHAVHTGVFDADDFFQDRDLVPGTFELAGKTDP